MKATSRILNKLEDRGNGSLETRANAYYNTLPFIDKEKKTSLEIDGMNNHALIKKITELYDNMLKGLSVLSVLSVHGFMSKQSHLSASADVVDALIVLAPAWVATSLQVKELPSHSETNFLDSTWVD